MNEINFPTQSKATIIKASSIALVVASIIFVMIILPAEYDIDPTGAGKLLGLTVLAGSAHDEAPTSLAEKLQFDYQENETTVNVPPNKGVEYKFKIQQYGNITYQWSSSDKPLYFDFHGEPEGDTSGYFESYAISTSSEVEGSMTVPFDGVHGWYWKNNSNQEVVVTLRTQGHYQVIGLLH